jgi:hypothetical protein
MYLSYLECVRGEVEQHLIDIAGLQPQPCPDLLLLQLFLLLAYNSGFVLRFNKEIFPTGHHLILF